MSRSIAPVFVSYIEYGHNSGFVTSPVQMTSPVIPNVRDVQDHMQWHAMLEHLTISADALVPKYMVEYFETVYQRCLIIPNDSKHVTVDHNTKHMKLPLPGYESMSLMYSVESNEWFTFIQSAKHPDHVAMVQIIRIAPSPELTTELSYYGNANILQDWDIEFPFMHRYIMHYEQAYREDWVMKQVDTCSGHSMGQISQLDNTTTTTGNIVSKLYNVAPRVAPVTMDPDMMTHLYKKYCL